MTSVIAGLLVVGVLAYFILSKAPKDIDPTITSFPSDVAVPSTSDESGGFTFFKNEVTATAPTDVPVFDLYLDFMCSYCGQFDALNSDWLIEKANAGEIAYRVHPVAILGAQQSLEFGAIFASLLETNPAAAVEFSKRGFEAQQGGLTDQQIRDLLKEQNVSDADIETALSGKYEDFIKSASQITLNDESLLNEEGRFGTPALFLNDKTWKVDWTNREAMEKELNEAPSFAEATK
ncbi:DsbA family protein [Timonella sp. A28]|uniref:DsbA family protein n=1 Tax=Timonella sp. A28 TaxID=3442640 RepID=UPI003EB8BD76